MIEIINNKPLTKSSNRQKELFEEWLLRQSPKTRITYSFCLKKFLCFLKSHDINLSDIKKINSKMIMLYKDFLISKNLSNKYMSLNLATLSSCFDFYYREQVIEKNPCDIIRRPPQDTKKLKQVLTPAEIERLEQAFRDNEQHLKTLFIVLTETGQRISSILNLKKKDILDLENRKVIGVLLKRQKQRLLPLTRKAEHALIELSKGKNDDEYIFTARGSKEMISIVSFNKTLKRKAIKARIKKSISSHVFRRTLINGLIEKGHSLDSIKNGVSFHSDIQTLYSYRVNEQQDLINNPILKNEYLKSDEKDTYKTPRYLIERLEKEFGQFTLDAAANDENKICDRYISKEENALVSEWSTSGIVFCNPPYSQKQQFLDKAIEQAKSGQKIIMLVPASPETQFFKSCKDKSDWLLCINGRLVFDGVGNSNAGQAKFATMLVFFNREKTEKLNDLGWSI
jgi:phage N-6-adenine-methyltransferase